MINTILIGLGRIGSTLEEDEFRNHPCTHAGVLFSKFGKKNFKLKAIYDIDQEKIEKFKNQWKLKNILSDLEQIKNEKFDFGIIATNSESHFENLEFLAKFGIKNILVEKPICLNFSELKKIEKLKNKFGLKLWVNHERRYHSVYNYVKEIIQEKKYGELRVIKASVLTNFRDPGAAFKNSRGPLFHDGTHAIDFIDFLLESIPKKIYSIHKKKTKNSKISEQVLALLSYPNNVEVFFEVGGKRNYFQFEIDVQTEHGRFILSNDGHHFFETKTSTLYKGFKSLTEIPIPKFNSSAWINLYKEIESVINNRSNQILGSFEANKRIFKILDKISEL